MDNFMHNEGSIFIVIIVDKGNTSVDDAFTSQYLADEQAAFFNNCAKKKGISARAAVVCRDLYSF